MTLSRDVAPRIILMLVFGTFRCLASIFITAAFASPSAGADVVCTRIVPSGCTSTLFNFARGITRIFICGISVPVSGPVPDAPHPQPGANGNEIQTV